MEHCIVNGERCSKCCEVLTIRETSTFIAWRKHVRNHGYPDDFEGDKIYHLLRKISKRRAKKINPHLVSVVSDGNQAYFTCRVFTGSGCGDYESRPRMCSGYPYYNQSKEEFIKQYVTDPSDDYKGKKGLYSDSCTYYIELN